MKKALISIAILLLASIQMQSQWFFGKTIKGNGIVKSEKRNTTYYDRIVVTGPFNVTLIYSSEDKIDIKMEENLMEYLITEVTDDKLVIKWKNKMNIKNTKRIFIVVPFKNMNSVTLTGSGEIISSDSIKTNKFNALVTGSGDITLQVEATKVVARVTGSGNLQLLGSATSLNVTVTGSGEFNSTKLTANDVVAKITGSGNIDVFASDNLNAKITGSGDIEYLGNPKYQNFKITGSGDIEAK